MEKTVTIQVRDRNDKDSLVRILADAGIIFSVDSGWATFYDAAPNIWKVIIYKEAE